MHDIQKDLVHTVDPNRCGNCKHPRIAHVDGACMFDFTMFRAESAADHMDCICEVVSEVAAVTVAPDGKVTVDLSGTSSGSWTPSSTTPTTRPRAIGNAALSRTSSSSRTGAETGRRCL